MNTIARTLSLLTLLSTVITSTAQEQTSQKSENEKRKPNSMYGERLKDFAEIKDPLPSDDGKDMTPGIIIRSFKKLSRVKVFTGAGIISRNGDISPEQGEFTPKEGMTFVRIIFDIAFELLVPTVLWKNQIELVVDGEKPVTPIELVLDSGGPSTYGLDGLNIGKRNRLAVLLAVKDTDPEKMVLWVNGKSYGSLKKP